MSDLQIVGLGPAVILTFIETFSVFSARCYFENVVLPKGNVAFTCREKKAIHFNGCKISGGDTSCEDYPECNGGPGYIAPDAGECDVSNCKIFGNAYEGILALKNKNKLVIHNNDIHHNRPFGISLDHNSQLLICNNKIFENGFWGILAKSRTSAHIVGNVISGNKCGGIFIGVNYSGRVASESNIFRDHSVP